MDSHQHRYEVKLVRGCELFGVEPFKTSVSNMGEMIITSKIFPSYNACAQAASDLLGTFASLIEQATERSLVLVSKLNPMYDPAADKSAPLTEDWSKVTILRIYVCDADVLKKEQKLKHTITATINLADEDLALMRQRTVKVQQ